MTILGDDLEHALTRSATNPARTSGSSAAAGSFAACSTRLVDTVEVAVIPVLLGNGVPLMPPGHRAKLKLISNKALQATGTLLLEYAVNYAP